MSSFIWKKRELWMTCLLNYGMRCVALSTVLSLSALAQEFPSKPVKFILPVPPGAGTDTMARLIGERLQSATGQPVLIEHRAGAGGNLAAEAVYRAPPDGYTLLFSGQATLVINKSLYGKINYDPEAFVPISLIASGLSVLTVNARVPANSLVQFIAYARANPGKLNYASSGSGTIPHLGAELFNTLAGLKIVHVPYKGMAPAFADVLGGQVDMMFAGLSSALPQSREGKVRMLGIGNEKRTPAFPELPAIAEVLPGFGADNWFGRVAPPGTPAAIANRISGVIATAMKQNDVIARLATLGFDPIGSTPAELAVMMRQESDRWAKVIRSTGAKPE